MKVEQAKRMKELEKENTRLKRLVAELSLEKPVLKDVAVNSEIKLSNFAALIVATDNPDTGRLWIEQAQPALGSKPMLMVVSSQAERGVCSFDFC